MSGSRIKTRVPKRMGLRPLLAAMAASGLLAAQPALATNYVVTNLNDDSSPGSLRAIIALANLDGASPHSIVFQAGLNGTITLAQGLGQGQIPILQQMTITGPTNGSGVPQVTISGNNSSRVFSVADGLDGSSEFGLTIENLSITSGNGKIISTDVSPGPGGCIFSDSALKLTGSIVSGCTSANFGGGIFVSANAEDSGGKYPVTLELEQSTISGNTATCLSKPEEATKYGCAGGGAFSSDTALVKYSTIRNNAVVTGKDTFTEDVLQAGGGLFAYGTLVLASTITGNSLSGNADVTGEDNILLRLGGGVANLYGITAYSTLDNNTVHDNTGSVAGPQYFQGGGQASGWGAFINSTVSGNSVPINSHGAGASFFAGSVGSKYSGASNSTFANNSGASGLAVGQKYLTAPGDSFLLNSTIVANTLGGVDVSCGQVDCTAVGTHNLVQTSSGVTFSAPPITADPQLLSLTDNGGSITGAPGADGTGRIRTHALSPFSPALNNGNTDFIDGGLDSYDERGPGYPRIQGSAADIGAFEGYQEPQVIPTLNQWGLGILSTLMALVGWRRRKP